MYPPGGCIPQGEPLGSLKASRGAGGMGDVSPRGNL